MFSAIAERQDSLEVESGALWNDSAYQNGLVFALNQVTNPARGDGLWKDYYSRFRLSRPALKLLRNSVVLD